MKTRVNSAGWIAASLLILAFGLVSPMANAQVLYGSIVGTVTDQTGAMLPKAAVKATNPQTGESRDVTTDDEGRFTIGNGGCNANCVNGGADLHHIPSATSSLRRSPNITPS